MAASAEIPHFDLPFRYQGGKAAVVEQDSLRDIQNCVEAIIRTHTGQRESLPDFGIADLTFNVIPIDPSLLLTQISLFEPRAVAMVEENPDAFDAMIDRLKISVAGREQP